MARINSILRRLFCFLCVTRLAVVSPALAEPSAAEQAPEAPEDEVETAEEQAKVLYAEGVAQFRKGRYDSAIDAFLQADQLHPSAALSYNIARAYEAAKAPSDSMYWYFDYLERAPDAPDREEIDITIKEHERDLAQRGVQLLIVRSNPTGAQVQVDGASQGTTPYRALLTPGRYRLRLSQSGYESKEVSAALALDRTNVLVVDLELEKPKVVAPPPPMPSRDARAPAQVDSVSSSQALYRPWPMVITGVGVAGLGAAGAFELLRSNAEDEAQSTNVQLEREEARERMEGHRDTARALAVGGAVVTLIGATLWVLDETRDSPESIGISAALGPSGFEASWRQSF